NELYCERVRVADVAKEFGTPIYVYSHKTIVDHYQKLEKALGELRPLICYSIKANSNIAVLKALVNIGAGLDIVSGGELYRARLAGADPKKIVYAGVGKTQDEVDAALREEILLFNVESLPELEFLDKRAKALGKRPDVAVRINPDTAAKTHRYITTGKGYTKFGVDFNTARWIFLNSNKFLHVRLRGIHVHIGSQIVESAPFVSAIRRARDFVVALRNLGVKVEYFNIGGGLGIIYKNEKTQTADEYAEAILPLLRGAGLKIILEPGRFIVGNAGILVTEVLYVKVAKIKNFIIVDAGMNDLVRPALYEAYHEILPVAKFQNQKQETRNQKFDVVGPICESGDFFALNRKMQKPAQGDLLAIMGAGAYGFSMSSNYNSRPRACEVMVSGSRFYEIRKRETPEDLVKGEALPDFLK
ncbi:MAG: diaminopimelate decarboxylase, partial [Candidatus Omnitrophica bacterium]|nr:diaminopimelate decarboxylase [Candidatus Omnitrophota bacterium]